MKLRPRDYAEMLYAAASAEIGVLVESSDREKLLQRLNTYKTSDPMLRGRVSIVRHPINPDQLMLFKRTPKDGEAES